MHNSYFKFDEFYKTSNKNKNSNFKLLDRDARGKKAFLQQFNIILDFFKTRLFHCTQFRNLKIISFLRLVLFLTIFPQ